MHVKCTIFMRYLYMPMISALLPEMRLRPPN
jgi:hypothetical protein